MKTGIAGLLAFALFGVFGPGVGENVRQTVLPYVDPYIFLFAGGRGIAAAMQQWSLHRRCWVVVRSVVHL